MKRQVCVRGSGASRGDGAVCVRVHRLWWPNSLLLMWTSIESYELLVSLSPAAKFVEAKTVKDQSMKKA